MSIRVRGLATAGGAVGETENEAEKQRMRFDRLAEAGRTVLADAMGVMESRGPQLPPVRGLRPGSDCRGLPRIVG